MSNEKSSISPIIKYKLIDFLKLEASKKTDSSTHFVTKFIIEGFNL